ncbi:uncharacterized protein MONBRDRAFT_6975 [Monosiga brevicollis MX1]|uniref:Uncharacterized protein n=1 Tax=Monosiga brevicollis TaxID=81824 RepID=A9UVI5_MONBE|nr:uncharacterized protein MONBRDRAFT_6975 [Monosiga brevicollis MX1]EDQ90586.1 predicted protein [Monosiga brevicollis MX1]|eukprot:XP_001744637.1 hypothetical protein [Monosiga brevicollis MX1]
MAAVEAQIVVAQAADGGGATEATLEQQQWTRALPDTGNLADLHAVVSEVRAAMNAHLTAAIEAQGQSVQGNRRSCCVRCDINAWHEQRTTSAIILKTRTKTTDGLTGYSPHACFSE